MLLTVDYMTQTMYVCLLCSLCVLREMTGKTPRVLMSRQASSPLRSVDPPMLWSLRTPDLRPRDIATTLISTWLILSVRNSCQEGLLWDGYLLLPVDILLTSVSKLHYYHGNIIILLYLSMFFCISQYQFNFRCEFRFWRHNNLLCCELNTTTQQYSHTEPPRHNNWFWLCRGVLCGNCCVVTSQHNNSLCCESAVSGNTTNCCVANFCVGKMALTGHRVSSRTMRQHIATVTGMLPLLRIIYILSALKAIHVSFSPTKLSLKNYYWSTLSLNSMNYFKRYNY